MQMTEHTCNFKGGMNKDLSVNEYPNTVYFDAQNFRVITDNSDGLSSSSLVTPRGNAASFTLPTNFVMLGYTVLRDYLILLTHNTAGAVDPDRVYKIALTSVIAATNIIISDVYFHLGGNLIYKADLGFNVNYPIRVIGNYESADIQKIYWVDGLNTLKHLNTIYNATYNDLLVLNSELLEVLPAHTYGTYSLSESFGGSLKAGRIQYSYQLYSKSGAETLFAPPSNLYNLTSFVVSDAINFTGNDLETPVNKSVAVTITVDSTTVDTFDRIRVVALEYEVYNDVPSVRVVSEQPLTSTITTIVDSGNSVGVLTLEEFQLIKNDLIPTTIESKNNYLFAGNITQEYFDVDDLVHELDPTKTFFDSRVYRWRYVPAGETAYSEDTVTIATDPTTIVQSSGDQGYQISAAGDLILTDSSWTVSFNIGAEQHCTNAGGRTWISFGVVDEADPIPLAVWDDDNSDWSYLYLQDIDPDMTTYASLGGGLGTLTISGTSYDGFDPSGLDPAFPNPTAYPYTDWEIVEHGGKTLTFTYHYSYVTGGAGIGECILNKGNIGNTGVFTVDDGTTLDLDVPENHDCINVYNNIANDTTSGNDYKYKHITGVPHPTYADLGGTGLHISYGFLVTNLPIAEDTAIIMAENPIPFVTASPTYPGYKDPQTVLDYTGYQRDEVYRFGIVFYDLKGRPSYPKWIGDIRMPRPCEEEDPTVNYSHVYEICIADGVSPNGIMNARILGVEFTISWGQIEISYPGFAASISGFQIVRCPRTDDDCTIKASGLIVPAHRPDTPGGSIKDTDYSSYNITSATDYDTDTVSPITHITSTHSELDRLLVELISPEIAINKNLDIDVSSDFLEVYGYLTNISKAHDVSTALSMNVKSYGVIGMVVTSLEPSAGKTTSESLSQDLRRAQNAAFVSTPKSRTPTTYVIDTTEFTERGYDDNLAGSFPEMTYKGTTLVSKIAVRFTEVKSGVVNGTEEAMYGWYRRKLGYSAYGGATYTERTYSQYIKASEFNLVSTTPINVYNGDTYICPFNFMKLFVDTDAEYDGYSGQVIVGFPVESRINVVYDTDNFFKNVYNSYPGNSYFIAERQSLGLSMYPNDYPNVGDLYRYNSAYSAQDISKVYISKPFDFQGTVTNDIMVTSSERKINSEYSDSWINFKYNNYVELEGDLGAITRIVNQNDKLIVFQARGISILSVLERELIQTNNTAALAVGSGGVLSRYDYITKKSGTTLYESIVPTDTAIYYYDDKNKAIQRISEGLEPLSDTKGLKSYFEFGTFPGMIGAYDKTNREVLFTYSSGNTLAFSGYIDAFSGFYTMCPTSYITFDKYLLSSLNKNKYYLHNVSEAKAGCNEFYGIYQKSSLSLIANPARTNVVTFHEVEWITDLTDDGDEITTATFDTLQILNTHQNTGLMNLTTRPDIKKRFRKWRINTFRDAVDSGRIRDSWIKAVFAWTQTNSTNKLVVHPINFKYIPNKIW